MKGINAAVLGRRWRLLEQHEEIREGDETERASLLMSVKHFEDWRPVEGWAVGMTVAGALADDGDAGERVFRRRIEGSDDATWNAALEAAATNLDQQAKIADDAGVHGHVGVHWHNAAKEVRRLKRGQS